MTTESAKYRTIIEAARHLIRQAHVDGGHCIDGVRTPDQDALDRAMEAARPGFRLGPVKLTGVEIVDAAAELLRYEGGGTRWRDIDRLERAVRARFPQVHEGR